MTSKDQDTEQQTERDVSKRETRRRRELLGSGAAAMATAMFGFMAAACSDDDDGNNNRGDGSVTPGMDGGGNDAGMDGSAPGLDASRDAATPADAAGDAAVTPDADIAQLNALLSAEYNAIAAYGAGAGLIDGAAMTDDLYALRPVIKAIAVDFQSHHQLHAAALADAITGLGGTPVDQATVAAQFTAPAALSANPTILNVLKFAASAERGAAVAYNQVIMALEAASSRYLATSIEGDESQHFIVLTALVLGLAMPGPMLSLETADDVVPQPFVRTVGAQPGLEVAPPDYFA